MGATTPSDGSVRPETIPGLNAAFYRARPADYFGKRLQDLMLVAGNLEGLDELFSRGVKFRQLTATGPDPASLAQSEEAKAERELQRQQFVIAESEVLCHHAGETLLRLYLAHESRPASPWLELTRTRSPSAFKEKVRRRFGSDSKQGDPIRLAEIARLLYLSDDREAVDPSLTEEDWTANLVNIEGYLRYFAWQFLDKAALYNAAKHGLALIPGEMTFQKLEDGSVLGADGPMIEYLELRSKDGGDRRWHHVAHWVRSDRQMTLTYMAIRLMAALWDGARRYYVPSPRSQGSTGHWFAKTSIDQLLQVDRKRRRGRRARRASHRRRDEQGVRHRIGLVSAARFRILSTLRNAHDEQIVTGRPHNRPSLPR